MLPAASVAVTTIAAYLAAVLGPVTSMFVAVPPEGLTKSPSLSPVPSSASSTNPPEGGSLQVGGAADTIDLGLRSDRSRRLVVGGARISFRRVRSWVGRVGGATLAGPLALLAFAASAGAEVLKARDVLPPGQSGYVSVGGVASGTGSPHLTDQIELFSNFEYKDHTFNQPGETEVPRAGVSIVRDAYGVPAITADSDYDAWWGVGYAVAQDRLFQLELFRRATSGRLSEILGSTYLDDDLIARRDYYTDPEIDSMLAEIPTELRSRAEAYRDGINAWIEHVSQPGNPDLPGEFVALNDLPIEPWTLRDTGRIGVFLARTVPSGTATSLPTPWRSRRSADADSTACIGCEPRGNG